MCTRAPVRTWAVVAVVLLALPAAADEPAVWKLPLHEGGSVTELAASADGRWVGLAETVTKPSYWVYHWLLDTQTGEAQPAEKLLKEPLAESPSCTPTSVVPSPSGKWVLLVVQRTVGAADTSEVAYLAALPEGKPTKVAEARKLMPFWAGEKLFLARSVDSGGTRVLARVAAVDPATSELSELGFSGELFGVDQAGKVFLAACKADAPGDPLDRAAHRMSDLVAIDADGKVLRTFAPRATVGRAALSPGGTCTVFTRQQRQGGEEPSRSSLVVQPVGGGEARVISDESRPVAVTDDGCAIGHLPAKPAERRDGVVKMWDAAGEARTLVEVSSVQQLVAGALLYVPGDKKAELRRQPLK